MNFRFIRSAFIFFSFLSLFGLSSCFDDNWDFNKVSDEIELDPGIAVPLAYGTLSLDDILSIVDSTNYIKQYDDSLLYIIYDERLLSYPASEVVDIPDQHFLEFYISSDVSVPAWMMSQMGDTLTFHKEKSEPFVFNNNERIDSINVKNTNLHIHVESSFHHTGILTIYSENVLIDGEIFKEVIQISDASGNFVYDVDIPIDGSTIMLDNSNPDTTFLPLQFDLKLINSGAPINADESCDISMSFNNIDFYSVFGYLGDYNVLLDQGEVVIDLYDKSDREGSLLFADPLITVDVENSYGIPVNVELTNVSAYSEINEITTDIVFNGVNPFYINAPGLNQVGESVETYIELDKDNCNIVEAMRTQPHTFSYSVNAETNPGSLQDDSNFVTDSSDLKLNFQVVLPIWIQADGFSLKDTVEWSFVDELADDTDIINYLRLTLAGANKLPMKINMQVYFADADTTVIDSLFHDDDLFMEGALLDEHDKVRAPVQLEKSVEYTRERMDNIKQTEFLIFRAKANTKDAAAGRYVKFYSYYTVDFKLKLNADMTINSRNL